MKHSLNIKSILEKEGPLSEGEAKALQEWYDSFREHDDLTFRDSDHELEIYADLKKNIFEQTNQHKAKTKTIRLKSAIGLAAGIVLILGSLYTLFIHKFRQPDIWHDTGYTAYQAKNGRINDTLLLKDGSQIIMTPGTSLSYNLDNKYNKRLVKLDKGQAYFLVKKDQKAFKVLTGSKVETTVTGTSFVIDASEGRDMITVTLVEGSVQVNPTDLPMQQLIPNEQFNYSVANQEINITKVAAATIAHQMLQGSFFIKNANLETIQSLFRNYYQTELLFDTELRNEVKLNFPFDSRLPLEEHLKMISSITELSYTKQGDKIVFKK